MIPFLLLFLLIAAQPVDVIVVGMPARGGVSLDLAPAGKAELERSSSLSRVRIEIDRPAAPQSAAPGMNTFVVWAVSPEAAFENLGALAIAGGKARLDTTTHFDQFAILISAEPHHLVDRPSAAIVYRNLSPRSDVIRRITVSARIGEYDYAGLPSSSEGGPAAEARAAFHLASAAQAERSAQAEFRLARVALDTMEELVKRSAPVETLTPAANDVIRRSQHALIAARENSISSALESARAEASNTKRDLQQLQDRFQRLTTEQAAAAERIRRLEGDLDRAARERDQLATSNDAANSRARRLESEVAEARRSLEELQNASVLRLTNDIFDYSNGTLSPGGVTVLSKVAAAAGLWKTPIRLIAPEKGVDIAKRYFAEAGVADGRIVIQTER